MATKATSRGRIATLNERESLRPHSFDADRISDALRRIIRQITDATLISARPMVLNIVTVDDIIEDIVEDIVEDIIDDIMLIFPHYDFRRNLLSDLSPSLPTITKY